MASIEKIKGSDGTGNASVATVQSSRSPGATTIDVDTVAQINPAGFMGTMGTPHTFTDPITSETITVISEATAVDFSGHVDGSNLEIDAIAPGYTDAGSEIGDIVIIRPTTQWSDGVAAVLGTAHNDDGSLKSTAAVLLTGIQTIAGVKTFSSIPVLPNNSILPAQIATNAITLGYKSIAVQSTGATTETLMALSSGTGITVTVPDGGRDVKISFNVSLTKTTADGTVTIRIKDGALVASGNLRSLPETILFTGGKRNISGFVTVHAPAAGSRTFSLTFQTSNNGVSIEEGELRIEVV